VASHLPVTDVSTASGAAAFLLMTPEHQDIEAIAITAEKASDASELRITLGVLTSAERRDFAKYPPSSRLERGPGGDPRILLLDLLLEADEAMPADGG
jgi:hypothetical protein